MVSFKDAAHLCSVLFQSKEMQKQILYLQLERLCGALDNLPIAELIAKAENLHQRFLSAANNGKRDILTL